MRLFTLILVGLLALIQYPLWLGKGELAQTNAAQVTRVRQIIEGLGLKIATPDEARDILVLKGGDRVGF